MNQRCLPQCRAEVAWTPRVHPPIAFRWAKKRRQSSCNSNFEAFLNWNFTPKLVDGWGFNSEKMCYSWSVGMMKFPTEWKHIIHVTNHQPEIMDESEIWNGKNKTKMATWQTCWYSITEVFLWYILLMTFNPFPLVWKTAIETMVLFREIPHHWDIIGTLGCFLYSFWY